MNAKRPVARGWALVLLTPLLFLSVCSAFATSQEAIRICWGKPIDLGGGGYARIHPLADGRLMAAYASGGAMIARFASLADLRTWSAPVVVARNFVATNQAQTVRVGLANAEFAQLETGRILYACNLRPAGCRHDLHPFAIGVSASDDAGRTWSPLKMIYAPDVPMAADGKPHGCYEPFVLPLKGAAAQIYFADETPYVAAKCAWQNISLMESSDGGETWGALRKASYLPQRRDGMPVVLDYGGWRYLAIEANPGKTLLHPQVIKTRVTENWRTWVSASSPDRFDPFGSAPDWTKVYGGAPYIIATENYLLLSWQENTDMKNPRASTRACVAVVPKKEVLPDGTFRTMRAVSTPPGIPEENMKMLWNSLCHVRKDTFLLVSECRGRIRVYPGRVENEGCK